MASSTNIEPQNERGHVYSFTPVPQSETETNIYVRDDNLEDQQQPLSMSVESSTDTRPNMSESFYAEDIFSISARTCEVTRDILGVTLLMVLIFVPLYKRLGSPTKDPIAPIFVLNSMYLSNFTTTASGGLSATWDAKFTVKNINVSSIYFKTIDFTLFYKQNPEDTLSVASSYPFYLEKGDYVKLHLKFTTRGEGWGNNEPLVENWLVEEMGKDKAKDGSLSFGMGMNVQAVYYGEMSVSEVVMNPHCENLTVQFMADDKDSGRLANPNRNFSVPLHWKPFSFF